MKSKTFLINKHDLLQLLNILHGTSLNKDPIWITSYLSKVILKTLGIRSNEKLPNMILRAFYDGKMTRGKCFHELISTKLIVKNKIV